MSALDVCSANQLGVLLLLLLVLVLVPFQELQVAHPLKCERDHIRVSEDHTSMIS